MTWWVLGVIIVAGVCSGLLLARIERVRIRPHDRMVRPEAPVDAERRRRR